MRGVGGEGGGGLFKGQISKFVIVGLLTVNRKSTSLPPVSSAGKFTLGFLPRSGPSEIAYAVCLVLYVGV